MKKSEYTYIYAYIYVWEKSQIISDLPPSHLLQLKFNICGAVSVTYH